MKNNISYYPHRADAHRHWKFKTLRRKYGWSGEGKFWALNNLIAEAENCTLDLTDEGPVNDIAADLDFDPAEFSEFLDFLQNKVQLLQKAGGGYQTEYTQLALEEVTKKRKYQARWKKDKSKAPTPPPVKVDPPPVSTPPKSNIDPPRVDTAPKIDIKVPPRKKATPPTDDVIPGWQQIVDVWFEFNIDKYGEKPSFKGADPKLLKLICTHLEKRVKSHKKAWNAATAPATFQHFLQLAYRDKWLKSNFLLTNLERFFDKVILNAKQLQNGTIEQQTGANVDARSAFAKIDAMFN